MGVREEEESVSVILKSGLGLQKPMSLTVFFFFLAVLEIKQVELRDAILNGT